MPRLQGLQMTAYRVWQQLTRGKRALGEVLHLPPPPDCRRKDLHRGPQLPEVLGPAVESGAVGQHYSATDRSRKPSEPAARASSVARTGNKSGLMGELIAGLLVTAALIGLPLAIFAYNRALHGSAEHRLIRLRAAAAERGGWYPDVIHVKQGEPIFLEVVSTDVVHGLFIRGLGVVAQELYPGVPRRISFVADQPGVYPFFCLVRCGPAHATMKGRLIVEPRP